jgi:transposase InsO family protein/DNA-binding transcriptional regulator YiaG
VDSHQDLALRALRRATHLFGLTIGKRIADMRDSDFPHNRLGAKIEEQALRIRFLEEANAILAARWEKIQERRRPHYSPELRFRILRIKDLLSLTQKDTATMFSVSVNTIFRWEAESETHPETETVGSLVQPTPPVRRYADVVRRLLQAMALAGFGGNGLIARTLARAGWKLSSRTVGRVRREKPVFAPSPMSVKPARGVTACYPNHVWLADITEVSGLFRLYSFKLAAVFDVFSRMPLAWKVFRAEPSAAEMADLVESAARSHRNPKHFVSDQGTQFTAKEFRSAILNRGIRHRFGAIGKSGSIALIERFRRTLKAISRVSIWKPLVQQDLDERVCLALAYYACHRPHSALAGATPFEIYSGTKPSHLAAIPPPRGRPLEAVTFESPNIVFVDPERRLPILVPKAA